ncbi:hypothetical protein C0989_002741 [Termitomyces sp. Mn162]|nr:hypothetical protein C0989_002741 [Termitomyces sp. Mn162]
MPQFQHLSSLYHKLLLLTILITLLDVLEDVHFHSVDSKALHGLDCEQFGVEEHDACGARREEVEVGKVEGPLGLLAVKLLGCPEVFKILVIRPDLELVPHAFEKVLPLLKQLDDGQHLLVMDLVVLLHHIQAFGVEDHWMPLPVLQRLLQEHHPHGKVGAVGLYTEGRVVIWEKENGSGGHGTFEGVKGQLLWRSLALHNILSCDVEQWASMIQEILDESLVEVGKPKEHLYLLLAPGLRPLCHICYLYWVHLHSSVGDDQTKVLNPGLFKLALLQFEVELVLVEVFQNKTSDLTVFLQ